MSTPSVPGPATMKANAAPRPYSSIIAVNMVLKLRLPEYLTPTGLVCTQMTDR
jgi:hypothetical protein